MNTNYEDFDDDDDLLRHYYELHNRWGPLSFAEQRPAFPNPAKRFIDIAANGVRCPYPGSPNGERRAPGIFNNLQHRCVIACAVGAQQGRYKRKE